MVSGVCNAHHPLTTLKGKGKKESAREGEPSRQLRRGAEPRLPQRSLSAMRSREKFKTGRPMAKQEHQDLLKPDGSQGSRGFVWAQGIQMAGRASRTIL